MRSKTSYKKKVQKIRDFDKLLNGELSLDVWDGFRYHGKYIPHTLIWKIEILIYWEPGA